MKLYKLSAILSILVFGAVFSACENETTSIGSVIATGEVDITIDTLVNQKLNGKAVLLQNFDSKTGNLMIGNIQTENYGSLDCSFVTRFMCASNLEVPDSLFSPERVDSCKLILGAQRDEIVGDSLAPQKLMVYKLLKQLNGATINNTFMPEAGTDYMPEDVFASRSYTLSEISNTDSAFYHNNYVDLTVNLPVEFGREIFSTYKSDPSVFQWPQNMAERFLPGIFVKTGFGKGCIANITSLYVGVFYHNLATETKVENGDTTITVKHVNNVVIPFTVSPEVLSSNNITYTPSDFITNKNMNESDGEVVVTTPGGYIAEFTFPAEDLIERYSQKNSHLSTVNDLMLYIPAVAYDKDSGIGAAQNILMIKSSEYENFFKDNKTPDNLTSFTGVYDSKNERYYFTTMRDYFLELLKKGSVKEEDVTFTLVPVEIETETVNSYYGSGSTYVTKCVPYTAKPTMTLLKTNEATIVFSFSTQLID